MVAGDEGVLLAAGAAGDGDVPLADWSSSRTVFCTWELLKVGSGK